MGPALIAVSVWSKALPLSASCLSPPMCVFETFVREGLFK